MGWTWGVDLWCVMDVIEDGREFEDWGWLSVYRGESMRQAIKAARRVKKETNGAVRVTWR